MKKKSFTLIEMMIVLVIISIITAIALPNFWGGYKSKEAKGTINQIASVLKSAKSYAHAQNRPYDVVYWYGTTDGDETYITLDIYDDFSNTSGIHIIPPSPAVYDPWSTKVGNTLKIHLNSEYVIGDDLAAADGDGSITFYPDGHADDADGLALGDETIKLTLPDGKSMTITINENTSFIEIGDLTN